jgi:hypothetical protein
MRPGLGGVWEVYELKPASVFANPLALGAARIQLQGYMNSLYEFGVQAQAGGTWNPEGQRVPWNGVFDAVLTSDPKVPGIIGYSLSPTSDAAKILVSQYGVDESLVHLVIIILLATAAAGSQSPLFQPR